MNERERFLAILVAGLLVAATFWWGFGKYRSAIESRENEIANLVAEQQRLTEQRMLGEYANRQMGEYMVRSLPSDPEQAQSDYQEWLLDMVQDNNLSNVAVNPNNSRTYGIFQQIEFSVQGDTSLPNLIETLHDFYAKDYLHRIREFSVTPRRDEGYALKMSVDAVALQAAPETLPPRDEPSWRVDGSVDAYKSAILDRNPYEPPNGAPEYTGRSELEAIVGRESSLPLTFKDAEGHDVRYEFAQTPPSSVTLDERTGTLRVNSDEKQELEVLVRAIDDGYPRRTTEQRLIVKVVDPPPPPQEPEPKLAFDDATQTVLTALVQGREEWTAWMHVRTRDKTLRLKVGDGFEIGSLSGTVVEVTPRHVTLQIDGRRFTLKPAGNLSEAAKRAQED